MSAIPDTTFDFSFLTGEEKLLDDFPQTVDNYTFRIFQQSSFAARNLMGEIAIVKHFSDLIDQLASIPQDKRNILNTSQNNWISPMREYSERWKIAFDSIVQSYIEAFNYPAFAVKANVTSDNYSLPNTLLRKQQESIRRAVEYEEIHGDPIEGVAQVLDNIIEDEDLWQSILDEPYG